MNMHVNTACPTASEKPKRRKRANSKPENVGENKADGQDFAPERFLWVELESRIVAAVERDQGDDMSRALQYKCQLGNVSFVHLSKFDRDDGSVRRVMRDLFKKDPTLFEAWAEADALSIGAHRIVNQRAIDDQAIGWLSAEEADPAAEVARRLVIGCLRNGEEPNETVRHAYYGALANRLRSEGSDLPKEPIVRQRIFSPDIISGLDNIAAEMGVEPRTVLRNVEAGELPIARHNGTHIVRRDTIRKRPERARSILTLKVQLDPTPLKQEAS
jgi:hypothetical protein